MPEATAPLMLLLPDAAGIAAYQLSEFPSPKAAEFFIDSFLRGKMPETAVMFWALNWEPKGVAEAEPLVLIRDGETVVYPFSFSDVESAFQFVRREMQRGLHLFQVMIYWAVPARAEMDSWGRSSVVPPEAPRCALSAQTSDMDNVHGKADAFSSPTEIPQIDGPEIDDESQRFLQDEDIADAVLHANHIATHTAPGVPETKGNVVPLPAPAPSSRKSKKRQLAVAADPIDFATAAQKVGESRATRAAIKAWSNFAQAVDEALDVYVARQVAIKLAWNRLSRALGQATEMTRRLEAKESYGKQEGMRKAWLNAAWTLEEASYAHNLEKKSRAIRSWRIASIGICEAAAARMSVLKRQRMIRVRTGINNFSIAVEEAFEAKAYRDEMIAESREALTADEDYDAQTSDVYDGGAHGPVGTPLFPGLWRNRDAGRWKPREEPFDGFKSPPGRFHHVERDETPLL